VSSSAEAVGWLATMLFTVLALAREADRQQQMRWRCITRCNCIPDVVACCCGAAKGVTAAAADSQVTWLVQQWAAAIISRALRCKSTMPNTTALLLLLLLLLRRLARLAPLWAATSSTAHSVTKLTVPDHRLGRLPLLLLLPPPLLLLLLLFFCSGHGWCHCW
jgi:hypothetical protein